jgi:GNAT superfamily N-acetyltransferase
MRVSVLTQQSCGSSVNSDRAGYGRRVSVQLRPMRDDEFADWLPAMRRRYTDDMVHDAGLSAERADVKATEDIERLFPGGTPSDEQLVFVVEAEGETVGDLWLAERDDSFQRCIFIFDIRLDESQRGKGYGKAAMLFAEEEARRRGFDTVALNVFGRNATARNLYRSLGYEENAVAMSKTL